MAVILVVLPVSQFSVLIYGLVRGEFTESAVGVASCLFVAGLYGLLVFPLRYGISSDELIIRHGVVRGRVALGDIVEVKPTRNPVSSPALSLDRLEVRTGPRVSTNYISPSEREAFMAVLSARSGLMPVGSRLVRG
jgi:hypothetical protein